jgi:hypothetical protein
MAKPDAKPSITRRQAENVRAAIKVGNIINRLQKAAMGEVEMTPTQLNAAKLLLDKTLPSLCATEISQPEPQRTREELVETLQSMVRANPELLDVLVPKPH